MGRELAVNQSSKGSVGSNPTPGTNAPEAQLAEHPICNREEVGSIPDQGLHLAPVTQLVRVFGLYPNSRRFESCLAHQLTSSEQTTKTRVPSRSV